MVGSRRKELMAPKILAAWEREDAPGVGQITSELGVGRPLVRAVLIEAGHDPNRYRKRAPGAKRLAVTPAILQAWERKDAPTMTQIARELGLTAGTVALVLIDNGITDTTRAPRRRTQEKVLEIARRHPTMATAQIAQEAGCSVGTVYNALAQAEPALRSGKRLTQRQQQIRDEVLSLWQADPRPSLAVIAAKVQASEETVARLLEVEGLRATP